MWKLSVSQSFSSPYVHIHVKTVKARGKTASFPFFKFDGHGFHCATTGTWRKLWLLLGATEGLRASGRLASINIGAFCWETLSTFLSLCVDCGECSSCCVPLLGRSLVVRKSFPHRRNSSTRESLSSSSGDEYYLLKYHKQ